MRHLERQYKFSWYFQFKLIRDQSTAGLFQVSYIWDVFASTIFPVTNCFLCAERIIYVSPRHQNQSTVILGFLSVFYYKTPE